ncbi:MAG: hypothetical protein QXK88_11775 [Desulfurococcaceae archaeon]
MVTKLFHQPLGSVSPNSRRANDVALRGRRALSRASVSASWRALEAAAIRRVGRARESETSTTTHVLKYLATFNLDPDSYALPQLL